MVRACVRHFFSECQFVCSNFSDKLRLLLCLLVGTFLNVLGCWKVVFEEREVPGGGEAFCWGESGTV